MPRLPVVLTGLAGWLVLATGLTAQTFTRITDAVIATDGGDSRSVNWIDVDGDGDLDLFVTNGTSPGANNFFYRNEGGGAFTKIADSPLAQDNSPSDGASWGDFDNDGDLDLYVANWYNVENLFYENQGGTFVERDDAGIGSDRGFSEACAWGDADNDGDLDLFVANSGNNVPTANFYYRNNGDGSFEKVTGETLVIGNRWSRSPNWADYDNDGDLDLFIANESAQPNQLFRNMLSETDTVSFEAVSGSPLVDDRHNSISGSWADYDNDGDLDLFVANLQQDNRLYRNEGGGVFTVMDTLAVSRDGGGSFGSSWGDVDNDGDLDLFVANGWGTGPQDNFFYRNELMESGAATFTRITSGALATGGGWSYGSSFADYDNDGDLDLFVAKWFNANPENNALYRNDGAAGNWITLTLTGVQANRSAIGARVRVHARIGGQPVTQLRQVSGQDSYCGQNLRQFVGLGDAAVIDSIVIDWPGGGRQTLTGVAVNQHLAITEEPVQGLLEGPERLPEGFDLLPNHPNPFNPETVIRYVLPRTAEVRLAVYDVRGARVATLVAGRRPAGEHRVTWRGRDERGRQVSSGIYLYRLEAGGGMHSRPMVLAR